MWQHTHSGLFNMDLQFKESVAEEKYIQINQLYSIITHPKYLFCVHKLTLMLIDISLGLSIE